MTAKIGGIIVHPSGRLMIPKTRDEVQKPLEVPGAATVVPSSVNGIPHPMQLLALIGLSAPQCVQRMIWAPSARRRI